MPATVVFTEQPTTEAHARTLWAARDRAVNASSRAFGLTCLLVVSACTVVSPPSADERYRMWLADGHASDVDAYRAYLVEQGVGDAVPMPALLRTSRPWRRCGHDEFALPPRVLWPQMPPTLRLVAHLRDEGLLDAHLARSAYRDDAINRCAGGAKGSKHLQNVALDFDLPSTENKVARLCAFWREHGRDQSMGLGFYTPTAIHIDVAGYRTWGEDHTRRTSLCTFQSK